ncbi:MAG: MlaE family lipid ABC transporter permease subunit [Immundisolibacter sp.]
MPAPACLNIDTVGRILRARGDWTVCGLDAVQAHWQDWRHSGDWTLDASGIDDLDTAGAWALRRLVDAAAARQARLRLTGLSASHAQLLELVRTRTPPAGAALPRRAGWLERLGRIAVAKFGDVLTFLDFVGQLALEGRRRLRWSRLVQEIDAAGVRALPILGLLAFLMGVVVTYQAGEPLKTFGANVLVVNLVGVTMLREMGPLLAAIIVAGRTGSAYTAEIGTMRITEELDALRSLGITPLEMLVIPKLLGLLIALPLLTLYASALGIFGGMVVADGLYNVGYADFLRRLPDTFAPSTFWVGLIKAPVFALIVATVACHRGFQVSHSAESIGRETTVSVVQSIFLVIIADAVFSVLFQGLGL